ncbi:hypothetical protein [Gordonia soli]|uniref:Uncharacterized protein n=1 Tax=Gordonia soli NBRC 108243 TaxID=1223545 RepID=M0QLK3_9ACTN|nr:hypothetical protein [Gordonia soli]GAC69428.1 hypothetical protein GS4_24_00760 [Gordonia soli NBRC 108243]
MSVLDRTHWAAVFVPGRTAVGHHWEMVDSDADDAPLGVTRRAYRNVLLKTVTLTGMDGGNDIRADVLDTAGLVDAQVFSAWRTRADTRIVEVTADGHLLGRVPTTRRPSASHFAARTART